MTSSIDTILGIAASDCFLIFRSNVCHPTNLVCDSHASRRPYVERYGSRVATSQPLQLSDIRERHAIGLSVTSPASGISNRSLQSIPASTALWNIFISTLRNPCHPP